MALFKVRVWCIDWLDNHCYTTSPEVLKNVEEKPQTSSINVSVPITVQYCLLIV